MTGTLQMPRTRGGVSGTLLVLLGAWGALIPFIGPYFDYAYTPDNTWNYTNGRLFLEILPGLAAIVGGLLVLVSAHRVLGVLGGLLAAAGGAWFVLGVPLMTIWDGPTVGSPTGDETRQVLEWVGFFGGVGVAIIFLAAFATGRFAVVGAREVERAREEEAERERQAAERERQEAEAAPIYESDPTYEREPETTSATVTDANRSDDETDPDQTQQIPLSRGT